MHAIRSDLARDLHEIVHDKRDPPGMTEWDKAFRQTGDPGYLDPLGTQLENVDPSIEKRLRDRLAIRYLDVSEVDDAIEPGLLQSSQPRGIQSPEASELRSFR